MSAHHVFRELRDELEAANKIIRQQQLLDEENMKLQERAKRLEEAGEKLIVLSLALVSFLIGTNYDDWTKKTSDAITEWNKAKDSK